ncbi:Csu type fimbrial protein [Arenimonas daejeonensis]|uniref:Csu type fimbrial protein n=1 Tax=Arenimonas daejeonensis TaxID=370777 RepID=UPI001D13FE10|nr:spore coat U domain-containing protein [Arenimonas daejeonensis]
MRVCVGISAGTGTGSTVAGRRMSITTPVADNIGYALYQDPSLATAFGNTGNSRVLVLFNTFLSFTQTKTVSVHGQLTPGQTGHSVGNYLSTLTVSAQAQPYSLFGSPPDCGTTGGTTLAPTTFQAHLLLNPACTVSAAPLDFGTVGALTGHNATSNIAVTCTRSAAYSIALNGGTVTNTVANRQMRLGAGPNTVSYQLYRDAGRTLVWGNTAGNVVGGTGNGLAQSVPVYGRVPPQAAKPTGTYEDTVTATVTY